MAAIRVNGGIINDQTLAGKLRYFKLTGPFAWAISDGSVNLPVSVSGGPTPLTVSYFVVGNSKPVPNSAAEIALRELSKQCNIAIISCQPALYGSTTQIHIACSGTAFGWGADSPDYSLAPANTGEDLTAAAPEMQAAIAALGTQKVYVSVGAANQAATPVTATVDLSTVTVVEVPFKLA